MKKIYKKPLMEETEVKFNQHLMAGSPNVSNTDPTITEPEEGEYTI